MNIDSHVHFWQFDPVRDTWISEAMSILRQDYLPQHVKHTLIENGIDGCIAVQADQSETETNFLLALANAHPFIKGVVGWIDLRSDRLPERLEHYAQLPVIKGWRHIVQAEPDGFLKQENFRRGVKALATHGYTYDILIYHHQLKYVLDFIHAFPNQRFVIDHCAKPGITAKEIDQWAKYIREIAAHPQLYCKLSGLFTEADWQRWKAADFYPYLDVVFDCFGTERLLFGSDWPVMLLAGSYGQWISVVENYMSKCTEAEKRNVFGGNALRCYNVQA